LQDNISIWTLGEEDLIYKGVVKFVDTKLAVILIFLWAFAEALVFPLPPETLLIPLILVSQRRTLYFAVIALFGSFLGGIIAFSFGMAYPDLARSFIHSIFGLTTNMLSKVERWQEQFGIISVLFSSFTGVPYKAFAFLGGVSKFNVFGFIAASLVARGSRILLLCFLANLVGRKCCKLIKSHFNLVILSYIMLVIILFILNQKLN